MTAFDDHLDRRHEEASDSAAPSRARFAPFPTTTLPEPIGSFAREAAGSYDCDESMVALPLLVAAGAAIGHTRLVRIKRSWLEPPICWGAVVAESGSRKSPPFRLARRYAEAHQRRVVLKFEDKLREFKADKLRYDLDLQAWRKAGGEGDPPTEPAEPHPPRFWMDDTTTEAAAVAMQRNPRGIFLARDELSGFVAGFDAYRGRSGGAGIDSARYLEAFHGRAMHVSRKSGDISVPHAALWIAGTIQPGVFGRVFSQEHVENGLLARLLLAWPPPRRKQWIDHDFDEARIDHVFEHLYSLEAPVAATGERAPAIVDFTADAKALVICFINRHGLEEAALLSSDLRAVSAKLEAYMPRLALVTHYLRVAAGDPAVDADLIDAESVERAVGLVDWFGVEAGRIYAMRSESVAETERRELAEFIGRRGGEATGRDLQQARKYKTSKEAEGALEDLVQAGYGRMARQPQPGRLGGRPRGRLFVLDGATKPPATRSGWGSVDCCAPNELTTAHLNGVYPGAAPPTFDEERLR